jgi:hypothetical protein
MRSSRRGSFAISFAAALTLLLPSAAGAHVKWFSNYDFSDQPNTLDAILTPTFYGLVVLSMVALAAMVYLDRSLQGKAWVESTNAWLAARKNLAPLIMRIGLGVVFLLSWQAGSLLAPELTAGGSWTNWVQLLLALLLLFPVTTPLSGLGVLLLYVLGIAQYGAFYMLDYALFVGVGYYLAAGYFDNERTRATRIPVLYATLGFSLCWVSLEKMVYPEWSLFLLEQHPSLTLGLEQNFFLIGAAFVEFNLGYLLIVCLLQRPLAATITLVFFLTTLVFGKTEVIGHTMVHAILVVFILVGPGTFYRTPITFHKRLSLRAVFAAVNFTVLLAIMLSLYHLGATATYRAHTASIETESPSISGPPK